MPTFNNQATLTSLNNNVTSNETIGNITDALTAIKVPTTTAYSDNSLVSYAITLVNSSTSPINNITITDNLGSYPLIDGTTAIPLEYVDGSVQYYSNGLLQQPPTVTTVDNNITITPITIPQNGNVTIIYETRVTNAAPLTEGARINNSAVISGFGQDIPATASVPVENGNNLSISKSLTPTTVSGNGTITYTFVIQNSGNQAADITEQIQINDTFTPTLTNIAVTLNGNTLTPTTDYQYNPDTGIFSTTPGVVTVDAATYPNSGNGDYSISPGSSVLTVTGTLNQ